MPEALRWFTRACDLKHGRACYNLGVVYTGGHGVATVYPLAAALLKKSCGLGFQAACTSRQQLCRYLNSRGIAACK